METLCFYMQVKYIKGKLVGFFHEFQKQWFMFEKSGVEKFMVEKSEVESSGVYMYLTNICHSLLLEPKSFV